MPLLIAGFVEAQVVQLPSIRQFSYSGGVVVPDGGTVNLGGVSRSASGYARAGGPLQRNLAFSQSASISNASVSVQVIDLEALDQAILNANVPAKVIAQSSNKLPISDAAAAEKAKQFLANYPAVTSARQGSPSYRDFKATLGGFSASTSADSAMAESNIRYYLMMGQQAEAQNRLQSARVYYRLAAEAMTPELLDRYQRVLDARAQAQLAQEKADANNARRQF